MVEILFAKKADFDTHAARTDNPHSVTAAQVGVLTATATLDFDLTAVVSQDLTITVTGAVVGDAVSLGVPNASVTTDTLFWAWVSAADTVTVRAMRLSGTPNPASGTFRVDVRKS